MIQWKSCKTETPPIRLPILLLAQSGYLAPHDIAIVSGFYDPEWRPLDPWRDCTGDALSDHGWVPQYWARLDSMTLPALE